ncbi:MAG: DUF655 domain-containing protein [Candidatus Heimdallarchaeota archaeon]|nr:DUF655 domain-containing protein [Candidatus Heimdallarchaeota archaeon]
MVDRIIKVTSMSYDRYPQNRFGKGSERFRGHPRKMKRYEENGIVIEVIAPDMNYRRDKYKDEVILQVLGASWFTLLEVIPEDENILNLQDTIALSKENRDQIRTIIGRLKYENLTAIGELQVPIAIDKILVDYEKRFVSFLNKASPLSLRQHSLHLLKGIGPKSLKVILNERKIVPFISFEDFEDRTTVKDIRSLLKQRVVDEVTTDTLRHRLFTRNIPTERK